MKKWMALLCVLCCLGGACRAEGTEWKQEDWTAVTAALASDTPNPVPEERRITVRPGELFAGKTEDGWANILLLSTDAPDRKRNFGRSDALMVCRVNLNSGDVFLLSLPEDALVTLPGFPQDMALRYVNCFGGPMLTVKTVNEALGLRLNRYCAVNMDAFMEIVDALGGVTMDLTEGEGQALGLTAGPHRLDGAQALRYVKLRRQGDGAKRARALLEAVARQAVSGGSLNHALHLIDLLLPAMDTNLTTDDLVNLAFALFGQETPGRLESRGLMPGEVGKLDDRAAAREFLYAEGE